MAGWRQAAELAMTDEQMGRLTAISRSRTEPASRVARAQMLLAYHENPSFCAVGKGLGVHHQTVQRCIERAMASDPLTALDDRPRPGKEPTITADANAWLVSLACCKATEFGYPHELWTTRLLARHAREHGAEAGHDCLVNLCPGRHGVQDSRTTRAQAAQSAQLPGIPGPPRSKRKWRMCCASIARFRFSRRLMPSRRDRARQWQSSPMTRSRESKQSRPRHRICRRRPGNTRPSRASMSTSAMARSACGPGST
jgi:Homeodomain-like domain